MLSSANTFKISDIQQDETEVRLTRQLECNAMLHWVRKLLDGVFGRHRFFHPFPCLCLPKSLSRSFSIARMGAGAAMQLDPAQEPRPDSLHFSSVFHATSKQVLCVLIHEVDVAAFHAARQKNAVSVLYHLCESVARPLHDSVKGLGLVSLPICSLGYVD